MEAWPWAGSPSGQRQDGKTGAEEITLDNGWPSHGRPSSSPGWQGLVAANTGVVSMLGPGTVTGYATLNLFLRPIHLGFQGANRRSQGEPRAYQVVQQLL